MSQGEDATDSASLSDSSPNTSRQQEQTTSGFVGTRKTAQEIIEEAHEPVTLSKSAADNRTFSPVKSEDLVIDENDADIEQPGTVGLNESLLKKDGQSLERDPRYSIQNEDGIQSKELDNAAENIGINDHEALLESCSNSVNQLTPKSTLTLHTASYIASYQLTPSSVANTATKEDQATSPATTPEPTDSTTKTTEIDFSKGVPNQNQNTATEHGDEEIQGGKKRPAKVFSFTFNPDQKTTSKTTFIDLEEDSLIQQKTRKEAENKRKTEGMKTFTIITNPNDICQPHNSQEVPHLNGHATDAPASEPIISNSKSRTLINIESEGVPSHSMKSPEAPSRSSWKKLVTQNLSSSSGERRKSLDKVAEYSSKQKIHQVRVEVIDDEQKKISSRKRDEEKRRSSLLEWEALQRQRLEDEEKNRINKNLSIKPVSAKIKELVKMHGSFLSMFSKDKKTDINGTVDGKDDIVFRKMSSDNTHFEVNSQPLKENPLPMKSPYIVKKILTPSKHYNMSEEPKSHKMSHKDIPKVPSSGQRMPHASQRSNSKPRTMRERSQSPSKVCSARETSQSPAKIRTRERSPSPAKFRTARERSPSPAKTCIRREGSPSPTKNRTVKERSPSPARNRTVKERSPSPARNRIVKERSPSPARNRIVKERSPSPAKICSTRARSLSPTKPQVPDRSRPSAAQRSCSREKLQVSEQRIRALEKKEKVTQRILNNRESSAISNEMSNSYKRNQRSSRSPSPSIKKGADKLKLSSKSTSQGAVNNERNSADLKTESRTNAYCQSRDSSFAPPIPPKSHSVMEKLLSYQSLQKNLKREELEEHGDGKNNQIENKTANTFNNEKRKSDGKTSIKDPKNRKEWLNKMLNTITSDHISLLNKAEEAYDIKSPSVSSSQPHQSGNNLVNTDTNFLNEQNIEALTKLANASLMSNKSSTSAVNTHESFRSTLSTSASSTSHVATSKYTSPTKSALTCQTFSTPSRSSAPVDSSYSYKTELSPPSTPTSLRSSVRDALLSDYPQTYSSKRGPVSLSSILGDSSSRSSSLTSTPFTSPRATPERVIRKDSIDPKLGVIPESILRESRQISASVEEQKENIAPSHSAIGSKQIEEEENPGLSSSFPSRSFRLRTRCEEKRKDHKNDEKESDSKQDNSKIWNSSQYKPLTFGKPSLTMKTMVSGVDLQRVSTSKYSNNDSSYPVNAQKNVCDHKTSSSQKESYLSNSYPRDNKDPIAARFSRERISLKEKFIPETESKPSQNYSSPNLSKNKIPTPKIYESSFSKFAKEKSPIRTKDFSERSTPDREEGPVSLASILSRKVGSKYSRSDEPSNFEFKPNLSFSKEMNDMTHKYRKEMAIRRTSSDAASDDGGSIQSPVPGIYDSDDVFDKESLNNRGEQSRESSVDPESKESSPVREIRGGNKFKSAKEKSAGKKPPKDIASSSSSSCPPKGLPKTSSSSSKQRNRVVRRNSSLKRNRPDDLKAAVTPKKERKDSEDDPADIKSETLVQNDAGWTKTKTTVRRARLGSSEKTRQIVRTNSGKSRKEKTFKADASKALEAWAASTNVQGKLMKKEGQRFSHVTEEEVKGGQRTTRSVARRVIRRGSRRLSGGGELLTETKETSSEGAPKEGQTSGVNNEPSTQRSVVLAIDDGLSRKMKTSTDGERYMTESVSNKDGKQTYTTEGVNNKTTNSVEVIGGNDFEAKREVQGKTGHRVLVERSKDNLGRPSTVVKKITSQSRVVITKTKRKTPVIV